MNGNRSESPRVTRSAAAFAAMMVGLAAACTPDGGERPPAPRPVDAAPVKSALASPVPAGRAEAHFALVTGGDQMAQHRKEAGLTVVVRVGSNEYRQAIASCREPGLGSALGGGTDRVLAVASCDGEYWLTSEPGAVVILRMDRKLEGEQIARIDLPDQIRAVAAPVK